MSSIKNGSIEQSQKKLHRIMFVTVGQSPRNDLIEEMMQNLDVPVESLEIGALDNLSDAEIEAFVVKDLETSIVTRLGDGSNIVLSKSAISERMAKIVAEFRPGEYDLVAILSTGLFRDFESNCPTVNSQRAIESAIISLAAQGSTVGIIMPLERQLEEFDIPALVDYKIVASHARDNDRDQLARALIDLAETDIIVLNSVAYTEADRAVVARASGKPVILARRIVSSAIRLLLSQAQTIVLPGVTQEFSEKLARLTPRERQVMSLVAEGLSNKAIARQLSISPKTVEIHRSNVLSKMEVFSSNALIRLVITSGHT